MVIGQEIGEDLLSDTEVRVVAAQGSSGLGKGEADLRQARESGIFAEVADGDLIPLRPDHSGYSASSSTSSTNAGR